MNEICREASRRRGETLSKPFGIWGRSTRRAHQKSGWLERCHRSWEEQLRHLESLKFLSSDTQHFAYEVLLPAMQFEDLHVTEDGAGKLCTAVLILYLSFLKGGIQVCSASKTIGIVILSNNSNLYNTTLWDKHKWSSAQPWPFLHFTSSEDQIPLDG